MGGLLVALISSAAGAEATAPASAPSGAAMPLKRMQPKYPRAAIDKHIEGCVLVSFVIDEKGRADQYRIEDSVPKGVFDQATLKALNGSRFQPPARPGRYAQANHYRIEGGAHALEHECAPVPSYEALNPGAAAPARELQVYQQVMPTFDEHSGIGDGGCVSVRFQIKHDGFVGDVEVLEARPATLAEPTIAALKQWQFQSFPPPDVYAVQTFNFAPDQVRLPDTALRASLAVLSDEGALKSGTCGASKVGAAK